MHSFNAFRWRLRISLENLNRATYIFIILHIVCGWLQKGTQVFFFLELVISISCTLLYYYRVAQECWVRILICFIWGRHWSIRSVGEGEWLAFLNRRKHGSNLGMIKMGSFVLVELSHGFYIFWMSFICSYVNTSTVEPIKLCTHGYIGKVRGD